MIQTATASSREVTVVLLGHDQADHRARALHYYLQAGVPCVAVEPSLADCREQLLQALARVSTPFVTLTLDADFALPAALDRAAQRLHEQPDAVAAQGYALAYAPGNSQVAYHKIGAALQPLADASVQGRLKQYALAGQQAWRAVVRTSVVQAALAQLPGTLDFAGLRVALSYALLAQGALAHLEQTDVVCELEPALLSPAAREERITLLVRALREWDAALHGHSASEAGFVILNRFVRSTYGQGDVPLLFTSRWNSVIDDPERVFEPRQYVELPYYNAALFDGLTALEFLCHAWPTGRQHQHALEGTWLRQHDLLQVHPNDNPESLQQRYWQALALSLFNLDVCQRLLATFSGSQDADSARELGDWLARLQQIPGIDVAGWLSATPSGQVLAAIDAATPDQVARQRVVAHLAKHPGTQIALVVLDLENDDSALQVTFDSVLASGVRNFKLVVLKAGTPPAITTARDTLHFIQVSEANWITHLNQAVRQLPCEYLLLLQAGDVLLAGGLQRLLVELTEAPACQAIAANEVQRDAEGRLAGVLRPGANLDLLRSQPGLMSRHWVLRRQEVIDLGGYSEAYPHAFELDLLLRLVESKGVGSLAHMDDYLVIGQQAQASLVAEALSVLNKHLAQLGYRSHVSDEGAAGLLIDYRHSATPLVSILLAAEGDVGQLQASLTAVLQRTRYPRYEVVVACSGDVAQEAVVQAFAGRVRVVAGELGASREALLNLAAHEARGEYLVLLSERCQVITPAWIESLLNEAQRPEVGVVGARLQAPDESLLHVDAQAPWQRLSVHSCAAVSGDCLMVRKDVFAHCEGLNALPDADVDLCLAVAQAGLLVIWTPQSQLLVNGARPGARALDVAAEPLRWLAHLA